MLWRIRKDRKGFTLVEVIVVAVIVAVLALVGIQLYQGYVTEARRNTAENLAGSAASYLQTLVNTYNEAFADNAANCPDLDGTNGPTSWNIALSTAADAVPVLFTCPPNATITVGRANGTVSAAVGGVGSVGTYPYKLVAANP
jgi:prepilin-type N-terminal cleavage/methylation domain-containing protein